MENEIKPRTEGDIDVPSAGISVQKSKKIIPIALILIALIVIGGIIYWQYIRIPREDSQIKLSEKEKSTEEKIGEKGISFKNVIEECEDVKDEFLKPVCIKSACEAIGTLEEKIERCTKKDLLTFNEENVYRTRNDCLGFITPKKVEVCNAMHNTTGGYNSPKSDCYLEIVEETGDESLCEKIYDFLDRRINCYKKIARIKNDSAVCQKISYSQFKDWCSESSRENYMICQSYLNPKNYDIYQPEAHMNWCLAVADKDVSKCDNIEDKYSSMKDSCYKEVAENKKIEAKKAKEELNESVCEKENPLTGGLDSSPERHKNDCYLQLAMAKGDVSLCNKISLEEDFGSDARYFCYLFFAQSIAGELNNNFNEEDKSLYEKYCKTEEDETSNDFKIFDEAREILEKTGDTKKSIDKCKEMQSAEFTERNIEEEKYVYCVTDIAKKLKDASLCKKYISYPEGTTGHWLHTCYYHVAIAINDVSICHLIPGRSADSCYVNLAVQNNDSTICDFISTDATQPHYYERQMCYDFVKAGRVKY